MLPILLALIVIINLAFAFFFIKDLISNWKETLNEPANNIFLAISSFVIFLLSTFGISDFAISTALYPKAKWTTMEKLPGTLNTQCVIPVAAMALSYITAITVDIKTLIICIIAAVIGAYIGPRFVVKLPVEVIKKFVIAGLIIASLLILAGKFNLIPSNGTATSLSGWKLILTAVLLFVYGALNNIGIGSYALTMATVYAMGLNPTAAFPIMMGAATFSVSTSSIQFIKLKQYSRKITLFTSIFGVLGVLVAVYFVKSLNTSMLQWLVVIVLIYSAISMATSLRKKVQG